ncbi:MAG: Uma2 family endonuclease [Okeania sp.]|nr:Uma2 family endonuclease [Okeania sp.]MEB3339451.1 Uma2 family endonuclease [Okeania sp.]
MNPSDIVSSEVGARLTRLLGNWVEPRRLGSLFDSSGAFILPDNNLKVPDVSFVRAKRLKKSVRYFGELTPDLVVEIKSQSDRIKPLEEKIKKYLELGAEVEILIDPDKQIVIVYAANGEEIQFKNGDDLTIPELFGEWELPIVELWRPVFDEEE